MSMDRSAPWRLERGATVLPDGGVRFSVWAPRKRRAAVVIDVGGACTVATLHQSGDGVFEAVVDGLGAGADYLYRVDGHERPDPVSRHQPLGVYGPSRVVDPAAFAWTDGAWRGREMADLVIYELHVGIFTEAGTFDAVAAHLADLRALGITAIELMPIAEFDGARNWGYDGVHLYAPQSTYGGPDALRRLVDAAHRADLAVILDVVYNHLGPEGNHLGDYGPYFTDFYHTAWGAPFNLDGPNSDEVRRYIVDNARYWLTEFHIDGLRLDAVHAICDRSATHILEEIGAAVHAEAERLGRRAVVIAESDLNDPRLVRGPAHGGYGLDAQWSDDLHHAVHRALTGEVAGYYADFGGVAPIAKALRDRFVFDGQRSGYRRRRHGAPATDVSAERFVVCIQNHDQVGNRAGGERLGALVDLRAQRLATALLLLSPYVPLLFMGQEWGETNPFLYFVSHANPALAAAVREGRRRELARFGWVGEPPDPQAEETFARSRLDRTRAERAGHRELLALHRDLLRLRAAEGALRPGAARYRVLEDAERGWLVVSYARPEPRVLGGRGSGSTPAPAGGALAVFNFAGEERRITLIGPQWPQWLPPPGPPESERAVRWRRRLSTEEERYGGGGTLPAATLHGADLAITLPPMSAAFYTEDSDR
jgi:maltooligosyltrehalose trehalohydrolase